jgi:hypothetical protein
MARTTKSTDPWPTFVGLLADALTARMDFPPRPSSAAASYPAQADQARPRSADRRKQQRRAPDLVARLTTDLVDALAARMDFPPRPSSAAAALAPPVTASPPRRRRRRSPGAIARQAEALVAHVKAHPGERLEEIASALRRSPRTLALPARKLVATRRLKARGAGRATRYYPA